MIIRLFLVFCITNIVTLINSQTVVFKNLTVNDGLSQSWVRSIYQDYMGFMWIGTDIGLNRYDGYNFEIYKSNLKDTNSLTNSSILSLFEDLDKNLWIGTFKGLNLYDRKNNRFIHKKGWPGGIINSIIEDHEHNLIIGCGNIVYKYDIKTKTFTGLDKLNKYLQEWQVDVNKLFIDKNQNLWLATGNRGLIFFNINDGNLYNYIHDENKKNSISDNHLITLYEDTYGNLLIGTMAGLDLLIPNQIGQKASGFIHYKYEYNNPESISKGAVLSIFEDNRKNLWIGTENGGLNISTHVNNNIFIKSFRHYLNDPGIPTTISNNSIHSVYQDKQGNIWIGTFGNGINIVCPNKYYFEKYFNIPGKNSVSNNHVNTFCEDAEFIWIGTEGGLNRLSKKNGRFKVFVNDPFNNNSLGTNAVWSILHDKEGNLWVGTWAGGLNRFDYKTETFTRYMHDLENSNSLSDNNVFSIIEDKDGGIWLGTVGGGLNFFDKDSGLFTCYNRFNSDITGNHIETLIESYDGDLWIQNTNTTGQFIERFDRKTRKVEKFIYNPEDTLSLSSPKVNVIFEDSKNQLWIGTDDGLNFFDKHTKKFRHFYKNQGLPDNSIRSIIEDNNGNLWIGTNKGLSNFIDGVNVPINPEFKNYTIEDGLQGNEFVSRSCLKDSNGKLYFGGINGFNAFYPDSLRDNPYLPEVVFTDFLLFNKPVIIGATNSPLKQSISTAKEIVLKYNQSVFSFEFAALNYILPEKNQYAYRMEGFDPEASGWNYVGNRRDVTYTNLDPGEYTLYVKASNNDGIWNENATSVKIIILPPWWKTMWFRTFGIALVLSLLVFIYIIRVSQINKRNKLLKKMVKDRTFELEEKNADLDAQSEHLLKINTLLEEKQQEIEEQQEELKLHRDELLQLNSVKDLFFSVIAHDLKSPFSALKGLSNILNNRYEKYDEPKRINIIRTMNDTINSIFSLLVNLLNWSKLQRGIVNYEPKPANLIEVLNTNIKLFDNQAKEKLIVINNDFKAKELFVKIDTDMIGTVIRNLVSNAIKYSNINSTVEVGLNIIDSEIKVWIKDNGVGIPKENLDKLFKDNQYFTTYGTKNEKGSGIGLSICKSFIEIHGGKIGVETQPGKGCLFYFIIPYFQ